MAMTDVARLAVNARWARSTPEQRREAASNAARARWANKTDEEKRVERARGRSSAK